MAGLSGLISRFRREGDALQPPTALADGVSHGPNGTWAWVVLPPRSTDELNTTTLVRLTATRVQRPAPADPGGVRLPFQDPVGPIRG